MPEERFGSRVRSQIVTLSKAAWPLILIALLSGTSAQVPPVSKSWAITLKVPSFAKARDELMVAAEKAGATVMSSGHRTNPKGASSGWIRFRVAQNEAKGFLVASRNLGVVFGEKSEQAAHAGEIEELEARGNRLEEHAARLRALLSSDRRMRGSDILYLQERLMRTTLDHDLLLLQMKRLAGTGADVSVNVTLFEPSAMPESKKRGFWGQLLVHAQDGAKHAIQGLVDFLFWLVEKAIALIVLIPLFLVARWIYVRGNWSRRVRLWFKGEVGNRSPSNQPSDAEAPVVE